jgi:hypothetical protein
MAQYRGWGRVYSGYLLLGKLVGEPAPTGKETRFLRATIAGNETVAKKPGF